MQKFLVLFILSIGSLGLAGGTQQPIHSNAGSLTVPDSLAVKARLEELFQLARAKDYAGVATYLVYRGKDSTRKWVDCYNYANPKEKKEIERVTNRIANFAEHTKFEYQSYEKDTEHSAAPWYVWNLSYVENNNHLSIAFAFTKIHGRFCLGDID